MKLSMPYILLCLFIGLHVVYGLAYLSLTTFNPVLFTLFVVMGVLANGVFYLCIKKFEQP